ncbi:hypothetical protein JTB14_015048 [Gonioctena quinquepunctata]|nr:hypothetical protein JTB14_015048 [Gonioctena quinquepunctata]
MCLPPVRVKKLSRRRINNVVTPYETVKRRQAGDPEVLEIRARHRQIIELGPVNNEESLFLIPTTRYRAPIADQSIHRPLSRETGIFRSLCRETGIDTTLLENQTDLPLQTETAVRPKVELPAEPRKRRRKCRMAALDDIEVVPENACDMMLIRTLVNPSVTQEIVDSLPDEEPRRWRWRSFGRGKPTKEVVHAMVPRNADS